MTDEFKPVTTKSTHRGATQLRLHANSPSAYLTAAAVRKFFDDVEAVTVGVDREHSRLGIRAGPDGPGDAFALSKGDYDSADVALKTPLRQLGIEVDDIGSTWRFNLEAEGPYVVADLSELVEAATGAVHCEECGRRFASEQAKGTHYTKTHDDHQESLANADADTVGEPFPDGGDGA